MGLLDNVLGNAGEVSASETSEEYGALLAPGEQVEKAYKLFRDMFIFTNKRLILIDAQGMTGKKVDYHSVPYRQIRHFSIETAGHMDRDAELKIWVGDATPISKQFNKKVNIYEVQAVLAAYTL